MMKKILAACVMILLCTCVLLPVIRSPEGDALEVYVVAGQSQGVYEFSKNLTVVNEEVDSPDEDTYYYGNSNPVLWQLTNGQPDWDTTFTTYAMHPMHYANGWVIGDIEPSLAYGISERTGHSVYIINICEKGRSLEYLNTTGQEFIDSVLTHALAQIPSGSTVHYGGVIFMHGEADASTAIETYVNEFGTFRSHLQSYGFGEFYLVPTVPANAGNTIEAMDQISSIYSDCIVATTITSTFTQANGLLNSDDTHYTQKGDDLVGEAVCKNIPDTSASDLHSLLGIIPIVILAGIALMIIRGVIRNRD